MVRTGRACRRTGEGGAGPRPPCRRKHCDPPTPGVLEVDRARTKCRAVEGKQVITDFARYTAAALPTRIRARGW
jgi:hypothetical protein